MAETPAMKVSITSFDIAQGKKSSARFCPVASALSRAFERDIWVGWAFCYSHPDSLPKMILPLPQEAQDFVINFDQGKNVEPFDFEISFS